MGIGRTERARGWRFLDTFQHPGRDCAPSGDVRNCNSNVKARSDEGVSVSHEADPTPDGELMFVTDERGGGVVPPGSSCAPGIENPFGNGGAHAFDISDPTNIKYARTPTGEKAVYISDAVVPAETFCDIHVIEQVPGEQRFIAAYYSQGIKIVDWYVDDTVACSSWSAPRSPCPTPTRGRPRTSRSADHDNGTRTYFIATNDIHRGVDVVAWTGGPTGSAPRPSGIGRRQEHEPGAAGRSRAGAALRRGVRTAPPAHGPPEGRPGLGLAACAVKQLQQVVGRRLDVLSSRARATARLFTE